MHLTCVGTEKARKEVGLDRTDATALMVQPLTHGWDDRNVAIAWTKWLLREDDSPQSILDAVMNGLAAGSVFGFCVDAPRMLARPPDVFVWTRRGACIGLFFSVAQYCSKQGHAISPHNLLPEGTRAVRSEELKDPWSRATAPSRPGGPVAFANEETGQ